MNLLLEQADRMLKGHGFDYAFCGGYAIDLFCCKEGCELVQIWKTEENEIFKVDFHHIGQSQLNFIEFLFNDKTDSEFIYARNHNVKRKLRDAFLSYQGMPYLAPEICLLYKSTDTEREGYQQDYQLASSRMSAEQL